MASFWQKTLFYLGLVDEDQEGAEAGAAPVPAAPDNGQQVPPTGGTPLLTPPPGSVAGRRIDPPETQRRRMSPQPEHAEAGVYVRDTPPAGYGDARGGAARAEPETQVLTARNFSDAQALADSLRSGRAVVLDLRATEPEMVRRLVDFTSGLTYVLDGRMAKIAQGVILVTPSGVALSVAEQERLAALGLYSSH